MLAADVRLDEPDALARSLNRAPSDDDALLLAAVSRWGAEAPRHVLGDYAFAAWDVKTRTLLCARDALGVRPLVYLHQPERLFAFASLPRAIHGADLIARRLDETALARRIMLTRRADDTLCQDVRRLPAAHVLEVSAGGVSVRPYWQLSRERAGTRRIAPEEAAQELRRLIDEAVRCRLPADGPVAAHLSGGLDSSAIAILAARRLRADHRAFLTYSFLARQSDGTPTEDETPFVGAVRTQEPDLAWMPIHAPPFDRGLAARMDVDRLLSIEADDPENAICAHAAAQGAHVVLSGWGGDEGPTFNGRGALAEGFLRGRWRYVAAELSALHRTRSWSFTAICRGEILSYLIPQPLMNAQRRLRRRPVSFVDQLCPLVASARAASLGGSDLETLGMGPDARENQMRLLSSPHLAERTENWASIGARYGMAFAFPMLDRRVLEFAVSLPSALFLRGGYRRRVFRDAMEGVLPEAIRWRHQKLMPLPDLLTMAAGHRDEILQYLDAVADHSRVRTLFDLDGVRAVAASLPSPDAVRAGTADVTGLIVVLHFLPAIAYLEQHY
ncbi:MAG: asparagine synthase-related protein [Acidobacteriota bacterium]|nr:asparagine synthase-related protein [Acidobacteriota bacterium]